MSFNMRLSFFGRYRPATAFISIDAARRHPALAGKAAGAWVFHAVFAAVPLCAKRARRCANPAFTERAIYSLRIWRA